MTDNPELLPGWRRALRAFSDGRITTGDLVEDVWLDAELGIEWPAHASREEFSKMQLRRLRAFERLCDELLEQHQIALRRSTEHRGYDVLSASEHAQFAIEEGVRRLRRDFRWATRMLANVDSEALTDAERARHAESIAKLSRLRGMAGKELKALPKLK